MFYDRECSECGDMITTYTCRRNEGLCDECYVKEYDEEYAESLNLDFAYDYLKGYESEIKIPSVFTWIYTEEEIADILLADAAKIEPDKMREYLNDLAHDDSAREWLEDYRKWRDKNGTDK